MENLDNCNNILRLIPPTTIGRLLLVKEGSLNGWWISFDDGRFMLDFREPNAMPPHIEENRFIESIAQVDPSRVDEYIDIIEVVEEHRGKT